MNQTIEKEFHVAMQWFYAIRAQVGNNKLAVIKDCEEQCPTAWALLLHYLNPFSVFHLRSKSLANDIQPAGEPYTSAQQLITDIMSMPAMTNQKIAQIKATLNTIHNEDVRNFAAQYLIKTVRIGVAAETVNKAIGRDVIPLFGCMLANKYFDHAKAVVGKTVAVTEKLDGIRALAFVTQWPYHADIHIYSRQGKRILGLIEVEQAIREAVVPLFEAGVLKENVVFDGELLVTNRNGIPSKEQYKRTTKIVSSDNLLHKTGITYNVFDVLTKSDFSVGESEATYLERRKALETIFTSSNSPSVRVVPVEQILSFTDETSAHKAIIELVTKARQDGKEGIMLNICDAPYVCKRTNNLLKVKVFQDCDLQIVGFQQGTGKFADTLGALLVDYKGNVVGVGSGMSDEQRQEFWNHQDTHMGRVVTVQYFEETNDADGNKSIRFPVFKELREEGKEVSYN